MSNTQGVIIPIAKNALWTSPHTHLPFLLHPQHPYPHTLLKGANRRPGAFKRFQSTSSAHPRDCSAEAHKMHPPNIPSFDRPLRIKIIKVDMEQLNRCRQEKQDTGQLFEASFYHPSDAPLYTFASQSHVEHDLTEEMLGVKRELLPQKVKQKSQKKIQKSVEPQNKQVQLQEDTFIIVRNYRKPTEPKNPPKTKQIYKPRARQVESKVKVSQVSGFSQYHQQHNQNRGKKQGNASGLESITAIKEQQSSELDSLTFSQPSRPQSKFRQPEQKVKLEESDSQL